MTDPVLVVEPDADTLARAVARRLLDEVAAIQRAGGVPSVVLTGGSIADRAYRTTAALAGSYDLDWSRVDLWWGDERFVPDADPERNAGQARAALLDGLGTSPQRVHVMSAADSGRTLEDAAEGYADELRRAGDGTPPRFDVLLLGVGPDGHVASLFPGHAALQETERAAVGVVDSPKPPPERITLTYPTLNRARKTWLLVSGEEKSEAVRRALAGAQPHEIPASGVRGAEETVWLLDEAAASRLPDPR